VGVLCTRRLVLTVFLHSHAIAESTVVDSASTPSIFALGYQCNLTVVRVNRSTGLCIAHSIEVAAITVVQIRSGHYLLVIHDSIVITIYQCHDAINAAIIAFTSSRSTCSRSGHSNVDGKTPLEDLSDEF